MHKKNYIYRTMLVALFIIVSAQFAYAGSSLLWRMTFDSPIVKTSSLLDFDTSGNKRPEFPLRTVMTEKSIFVLDNMGKIANKISLTDYDKTAMSDDGMTFAAMKGSEITLLRIQESGVRSQNLEYKSQTLALIPTLEKGGKGGFDNQILGIVKIADMQPVVLPQNISFELSPNGEYIIVISNFTHTIYFHNNAGTMLSKHHFDDVKGTEIKFSGDSNYAAIHVPNWWEGKTSGYLLFFNRKGEKLWQFDHKGNDARFDVSFDGNSIVMVAEDRLYSLARDGKVIYENELVPGGINIALSNNGRFLAMTKTADHSVFLLDNRDGKKLWEYNVTGFDPINSPIASLRISEQGNFITVAISKNWSRGSKENFLYRFDIAGNLTNKITLKENRIDTILSHDGNRLLIKGNRDTYLYSYSRSLDNSTAKIYGVRK